MTAVSVVLILFLISGIGCAWFAARRNRNQAGWFLLGCLTGPFGVLILLLLPPLSPLPESLWKTAVGRVIAGVLIILILVVVVGAGGAEFWERYQEGERYVELDNWASYGDALIRFTKSTEHPADAIVVKAAHKQIDDYERQLREGMRRAEAELQFVMEGVRHSKGARALLANGLRLLTFRAPQWPAPIQMNGDEQFARVTELKDRLHAYQESLSAIEAAKTPPVAAPATQ